MVLAEGELMVNSRPWATLYVDGEEVGATRWKGKFTVGYHQLKLVDSKGRTTEQTVSVREGVPTRFCWDFALDSTCPK